MNISAMAMRDALSTFATGVTIVTTSEKDASGGIKPVGMTASSFNSVSMDPPLVLWSVTKSALSAPVFSAAEHFSIHILSSDQIGLSNRFAQSGTDKFDGVAYAMDARDVPLLSAVACRFDCSLWNVYEGGDHWIIVGKVEQLERAKVESLVFSGGSYATASPIRTTDSHANNLADEPTLIDDMLIYNLARAYREISTQFHQGVRDCGLSVPEWRILASLHGNATRDLNDLAARTFIDPHSLVDMLIVMEQTGLCTLTAKPVVGDADLRISGTDAGHARVEHLFALGRSQERIALSHNDNSISDNQELQTLIQLLQRVTHNTAEKFQRE